MGFHGTVVRVVGPVGFLLDEVRLGETLFHVAEGKEHFPRHILFRPIRHGKGRKSAVTVEAGGPRIHGFFRIEEGFELTVLHPNSPCRLPGSRGRFRQHRTDDIANISHPLVEESGIVGRGFGISLPGRGVQLRPGVARMKDIHHPLHAPCGTIVDGQYLRMGVGGIKEDEMERILHLEVCGIPCRPAGQGKGVHLQDRFSDHGKITHGCSSSLRRDGPPR